MSRPSPLKAACAARGWTFADLGEQTGYSPGTLGLVSRGAVAPWPELVARLEAAFGFDPFTVDAIPLGEPA